MRIPNCAGWKRGMAERVGFEPTIPVKVCPLSRRIVSTTHAPLRVENIGHPLVVSCQWSNRAVEPLTLFPSLAEERLQQLRTPAGQHTTLYLHAMV